MEIQILVNTSDGNNLINQNYDPNNGFLPKSLFRLMQAQGHKLYNLNKPNTRYLSICGKRIKSTAALRAFNSEIMGLCARMTGDLNCVSQGGVLTIQRYSTIQKNHMPQHLIWLDLPKNGVPIEEDVLGLR